VLADQVLYSGVACISDLIVKEGLINLDFADVLTVMREKGKAMMGRGEASGEKRVLNAAVAAISNPLIENASIKRASGLIISITGGRDLALYEVDEAATRIREEVDADANIIVGATFDDSLEGIVRVSVVATGIDNLAVASPVTPKTQPTSPLMELAGKLRNENLRTAERIERAAQSQLRSPALDPAVLPPQPSAAIPISDHPRSAARRGPDPHGRMSTVRNSIEAVLDMPALLSRKAN
jgi:cell division protein FtsZ